MDELHRNITAVITKALQPTLHKWLAVHTVDHFLHLEYFVIPTEKCPREFSL